MTTGPIAKPESRQQAHSGVPNGGARARVLVADDDTEMRELLASILREDGYDVIEVRDGWQLLQYLATHTAQADGSPVDLVISDIHMPGKNGLDVLAGLRCADTSTPVILITGFGDMQTHLEARRLGATAVLDKPFDIEQLRSVILNLLA